MTGCSNGLNAGDASCRSGMVGTSADIRRGDDGMHAGARQRGALVDRADAAVRDRAAQDHGVQHVREGEIIDVLAAPAQKPEILDAFDRAADQRIPRAWRNPCQMTIAALLVEQRARDAQGGERRGLRVACATAFPAAEWQTVRRAFGLDLVHVAGRAGIGNELDLRSRRTQPGERHRRRDIGILRIEQSGFARGAGVEHRRAW